MSVSRTFYVPRDEKGNYRKYDSHGDAYADVLEVMKTLTPATSSSTAQWAH